MTESVASLDVLTFGWFASKALAGLAIGYTLRIIEHYAFWKSADPTKVVCKKYVSWCIVALVQAICTGLPVAYVLEGLVASRQPGITFLTVSGYLIPVFTSFAAIDLRMIMQRIQKL